MENKNFKDLKLWQEARSLVKDVYEATKRFPDSEKYCLGIPNEESSDISSFQYCRRNRKKYKQ